MSFYSYMTTINIWFPSSIFRYLPKRKKIKITKKVLNTLSHHKNAALDNAKLTKCRVTNIIYISYVICIYITYIKNKICPLSRNNRNRNNNNKIVVIIISIILLHNITTILLCIIIVVVVLLFFLFVHHVLLLVVSKRKKCTEMKSFKFQFLLCSLEI